jgi:hypothetical protein
MPRRPRYAFGGMTGTGIWWKKRYTYHEMGKDSSAKLPKLRERDDKMKTHQSKSSVSVLQDLDHPVSTTTGAGQLDLLDNDCHTNNDPSSSPIPPRIDLPVAAAVDNHSQHSKGQTIGWDDDLCRPIYYHQGDIILSRSVCSVEDDDGDNGHELGKVFQGQCDSGDKAIHEKYHLDTNGCDDITLPTSLPFTIVPDKSRRMKLKTFGGRTALRRPFSLVLSQQQQELSPEKSLITNAADEKELNENDKYTRHRRTVQPNWPYPIYSLASQPILGQSCTNLSTPPKARRVSTSPASCHPVSGDYCSVEDAFAFDYNTLPSQSTKRAQWEKNLNRERAFFIELDRTQKLNVEGSLSPQLLSPVLHAPVLRAPKFIFRPSLQRQCESNGC